MFRYLVAHLPTFRLERCGWASDQPVALVAEERSALRIQCTTPPALRKGVRPGMTVAEARALMPPLQIEILDEPRELEDLHELTDQLLRISPNVAPLPPDAVIAEISRLPGSHDGLAGQAERERDAVHAVQRRLSELGHPANIVVADDPAIALAVAAHSRPVHRPGLIQVLPPGENAHALAPLPLQALCMPPREQALLESLGVDTVGDFAALAPATIVGRLGPIGVAAHAMARGGARPPIIAPADGDRRLLLGQDLPDPVVQLDALLFIINALLQDGCARLSASGGAATRVVIGFALDGGGHQQLRVRMGEPTRSPRRILDLLRLRLERFALAGPVLRVDVELPEPAVFDGRQHDLLDRSRTTEAIKDVLARLQDDLGSAAVITPEPCDVHRPEASWRPRAPLSQPPRTPSPPDDPEHTWAGAPRRRPPDRPPILLPAPQAIGVRSARGALPMALEIDGRWFEVRDARGPERLASDWWSRPFRREYWRMHLEDGRQAWTYREDGAWALHGWWDR